MSAPGIQLAPHGRDDLRGDVAEQAGVSTREALRVLADVCHVAEAFLANDLLVRQMPIVARYHRRDLAAARHARAIIAAVAPAICSACGAINVLWFEPGGAARYPCVGPGCSHRVIPIHASPDPGEPRSRGTPSLQAAVGQAGDALGEQGALANLSEAP